jgi:hypothetical protein
MTTFHADPADVEALAGEELELVGTDDGLILTAKELDVLGLARTDALADELVTLPANAIRVPLERLGRLTARRLSDLAKDRRRGLEPRDPHDAADAAWQIVGAALDAPVDTTFVGGRAMALDHAVNAFTRLDAYAHAHDERVGNGNAELERVRDELIAAQGRAARLDRLISTVLEGARQAGGADAFEGRYEALGVALNSLAEQRAKP